MRDEWIGADTYADNDKVHGQGNGLSLNRYGAAATRFVRFAQGHYLQNGFAYTSVGIGMILNGVVQGEELDTLFPSMAHLLHTGRHLVFGTAVDNHGPLRAQTFGSTHCVHGGVASADDSHVGSFQQRCVGISRRGVHQIDTGEVLVARHDAIEVFARYAHKAGQAGTTAYEDSRIAFLLQVVHSECLADDCILAECYAQLSQTVYLFVHNAVGQTELGNTVFEHAAYLVQCLKDRDLITELRHVSRKG